MIQKGNQHARSIFIALLITAFIMFELSLAYAESSISSLQSSKGESKISLRFETNPKALIPGKTGTIVLFIETAKEIKLTNYPQTSITLSGNDGISFENNTAKLGDGKLPDDLTKNYISSINPIEFKFTLAEDFSEDHINIKADVSYFYCETKSGFCAPGKTNAEVQIPVKKRP